MNGFFLDFSTIRDRYLYSVFFVRIFSASIIRFFMYYEIIAEQRQVLEKLLRKKNLLSWLRLLSLLASVYFFYLMMYQRQENLGIIAFLLFALFLITVTMHLKVQAKIRYHETLKRINEEEAAFLKNEYRFDAGSEFLDPQHAFSYDLDLFGLNSIFQFLNRTGTWLGKNRLAQDLQQIPETETILQRQEAVKELREKTVFRQHFQTLAHLAGTTEKEDLAIKRWSESEPEGPTVFFRISAVVFPALFLVSLGSMILDLHPVSGKLTAFFFTLNLMCFGMFSRYVMKEIGKGDKIANSLQQYAGMISAFEQMSFQSVLMRKLQATLKSETGNAATALGKLASYFEKLNTVANVFVLILFNGTFQYHFWVHRKLLQWKKQHQAELWGWISVIGILESLNSIANFAYNNPSYSYPKLSDQGHISFKDLGHPLIPSEKRVRNSIDFSDKRFVILTGSNMSGKSTFLRTVGINLILGYCGAPIDSTCAFISPLPLWVSMRLTDSLSDSESFFYAEVKRLKEIVSEAERQPVFVLLDEILKGTNSDDKKTGTVGVIEKLHALKVTGMIATHDLEVCKTTDKHSGTMTNKRFEVEIWGNELHFDYKLKEGICENKNATFIMKKMGII